MGFFLHHPAKSQTTDENQVTENRSQNDKKKCQQLEDEEFVCDKGFPSTNRVPGNLPGFIANSHINFDIRLAKFLRVSIKNPKVIISHCDLVGEVGV